MSQTKPGKAWFSCFISRFSAKGIFFLFSFNLYVFQGPALIQLDISLAGTANYFPYRLDTFTEQVGGLSWRSSMV